ncbi:MAG: hypothetical protein ACI9VL_001968, partial [Colwellia sp.]
MFLKQALAVMLSKSYETLYFFLRKYSLIKKYALIMNRSD